MRSGQILVTGASRGIGEAIAVELDRRGFAVAGLSRSGVSVVGTGYACDMTDERAIADAIVHATPASSFVIPSFAPTDGARYNVYPMPFGGPLAHKAFALAVGLELFVTALAGPEHSAVLLVARPEHDPVSAFRDLAAGVRLPGDA